MANLTHDCLEHIFKYLNCGPKELAVLANVCTLWRSVVKRHWKREVNVIEIKEGRSSFDIRLRYISAKTVPDILEHALEHVAEIKIATRGSTSNIRFGNEAYNVTGKLIMDTVHKSFAKYPSSNISNATILADDLKLLQCLLKSRKTLKNLHLIVDEDCFFHTGDDDWNHNEFCTKICRLVCRSFPLLQCLTLSFSTVINEKSLILVEELLSTAPSDKLEVLFDINFGIGARRLLSIVTGSELSLNQEEKETIWSLKIILYLSKRPRNPLRGSYKIRWVGVFVPEPSNSEEGNPNPNPNPWPVFERVDPNCQKCLDDFIETTLPSLRALSFCTNIYAEINNDTLVREFAMDVMGKVLQMRKRIVINDSLQIDGNEEKFEDTMDVILPFEDKAVQIKRFLENKFQVTVTEL